MCAMGDDRLGSMEQEMAVNENANFSGKVAFVTGAANGIGRAAALAFARGCQRGGR